MLLADRRPYRAGHEAAGGTRRDAASSGGGRENAFASSPQSSGGRGLIGNADVIVGLEVPDLWGAVNSYRDQLHRSYRPVTKPGVKLVSITTGELNIKSNYQYFQRYTEVDMGIVAADPEATLPSLNRSLQAPDHCLTASGLSRSAAKSWQLLTRRPWSGHAPRRPTHGMKARSAPRACPLSRALWAFD